MSRSTRAALLILACTGSALSAVAQDAPAFVVDGDAIATPLTATPGDAARGRAIVTSRQTGLCLLCHAGPFAEEPFQGTLAPSLAGVGKRLTVGQLRLRLVDSRRLEPATIMPAYGTVDGGQRVGAVWRGQPLLAPQQIEDVVALLTSLRE